MSMAAFCSALLSCSPVVRTAQSPAIADTGGRCFICFLFATTHFQCRIPTRLGNLYSKLALPVRICRDQQMRTCFPKWYNLPRRLQSKWERGSHMQNCLFIAAFCFRGSFGRQDNGRWDLLTVQGPWPSQCFTPVLTAGSNSQGYC